MAGKFKIFFYVLEIVSVVITFLAKPMPQSEDINWNIQTGNVIQMLHPGNVNFLNTLKKFPFLIFFFGFRMLTIFQP